MLVKTYCLRVNSDLEELKKVLAWVENVMVPLLPSKVCWQCQVALVEAFTNIVRHAHQHLPSSTPIDIQVNFLDTHVEIQLWDLGPSFDLATKLKTVTPEASKSLENEGGRGLFFMQQLMDDLVCLRKDNKNCLIMRKRL